ncbi:MAG: twin-arginine translocase subunit TatC [Acidimicrobiales bacterium]
MVFRLSARSRRTRPSPEAMTLAEHLGELRRRLTVSVIAFAAAATVSFVVYPSILHFLQSPYCHVTSHCRLYVTGPLDGLSLRVKLAAYGGLFLGSPVFLWQLWRFITPGLRRNEKRYAIPFVAASIVLFSAGAVLAYYTFPHALSFLQRVGGPSLQQIYDPNKYLGLIVALMTVFGLTFEFPVILVSLELAGVLTPARLSSWRRWAIVMIVVVAAVITPSGDPFSMLALAVPLYGFYELSIVVGKLLRR